MRKLVFLFLLISTIVTYPQEKRFGFVIDIEDKIKNGDSNQEVKKKLGNPKTIELGFPDSDELFINEIPESKGQLNYITWFYFLKETKIKYPSDAKNVYYLNNRLVSKEIYSEYEKEDSVYYLKNSIISPLKKNSFGLLYKTKLISKVKKDEETFVYEQPARGVFERFLYLHAVTFERLSNVVIRSKLYLLNLEP